MLYCVEKMHWIFHVESSPLSYNSGWWWRWCFEFSFLRFSRRCVMDSITSATNERRPCHHHLACIYFYFISVFSQNLSSSTLMTVVAASKLIMSFFPVRFLFRILAESKTEVRGGHVSVDLSLSADACLKFVNSSCVCFFICMSCEFKLSLICRTAGWTSARSLHFIISPDLPRWGLVAINRRVLYIFRNSHRGTESDTHETCEVGKLKIWKFNWVLAIKKTSADSHTRETHVVHLKFHELKTFFR